MVKYDNQLNSIPFRNFKPNEMNIFFSIVSRMRDKGTSKIKFSFNDLKNLSNYKRNGSRQVSFYTQLKETYNKMLSLNMFNEDDGDFHAWVLFTEFSISRKNQEVIISVNPSLQHVLNNLVEWTRFGLEDFVSLRSSYAKTMFRLLKAYRTLGVREFTIDSFRYLLDVPKSYATNDMDKRILRPIKEELSPFFQGLAIKKKKSGRGGKIVGYKFTWKPENNNSDDFKHADDEQKQIDNVKNNSDLNHDEKCRAIDKILNLKLGSTKDLKTPTLQMVVKKKHKKRRFSKKKNVRETLPDWGKHI